MNVMVIGAEHSCTRIISGLLKIHPQIGEIGHVSLPSGVSFGNLEGIKRKFKLEKIILVTRDRSCNDLSMIRESGMKAGFGKKLAGKPLGSGVDFAMSHALPFLEKHKKDVVVVSIEAVAQHKELVLRQTFRLLGLDEDKYDYHKGGQVSIGWFTVDLAVRDPNTRYFGGQKWPSA